MRLIDADAFRKEMYEYVLPYTTGNLMGAADTYHRVIHLLEEAPTVDAVPVVRCKDCDDWREHGDFRICEHFSSIDLPGLCQNIKFATGPDDYCSFGFRIKQSETEKEEIK